MYTSTNSRKLIVSQLIELGAHLGSHISTIPPYMFHSIYGWRNNYAIIEVGTTIYNLKKACFFIQQCGRNQSNLLFFHSSLFTCSSIVRAAFSSLIYKNNHSFVDNRWSYGMLTNFITHFEDIFSYIIPEQITQKKFTFQWLFIKVLFHVLENKIPSMDWKLHLSSSHKFWRFLSFFKCYRMFNRLPVAFIYINPRNDYAPTRECNYLSIPVVGTVDTDFSYLGVSFPIISNDNSLLLSFFYYALFVDSYSKGELGGFLAVR